MSGDDTSRPPSFQAGDCGSLAAVATARLGELTRVHAGSGNPRPVIGGGDGIAPELVPFELSAFDTTGLLRTSWATVHLRWMLQKDRLGQVCVSVHSSPSARSLSLAPTPVEKQAPIAYILMSTRPIHHTPSLLRSWSVHVTSHAANCDFATGTLVGSIALATVQSFTRLHGPSHRCMQWSIG
jgi:hypothetical protein